MAQIPSTSTAFPDASFKNPRYAPVFGLKASIRPRVILLEIKSALLNGPKSDGASATPHGECSGPLTLMCVCSAPAVENADTKPLCALFNPVYVTHTVSLPWLSVTT